MSNNKQSDVAFLMMKNWKEQFDTLTNEQRGILLKAIYDFQCDGVDFYTTDGILNILWISIRQAFIINNKKYDERCEINRLNAARRWDKNANASIRISKNAKDADIDIDKEIDKDIDNDVDFDIVEENDIVVDSDCPPALLTAINAYKSKLDNDSYNTELMLSMDDDYPEYTNGQICALYEIIDECAMERYLEKANRYPTRNLPQMVLKWAVEDGNIIL